MRYFTKRDVIIILLVLLVVGVLITIAVERGKDRREGLVTVCGQVELVKKQIRVTVTRSKESLPTIRYYQDNPDELAKALENADETLAQFNAINCEALF